MTDIGDLIDNFYEEKKDEIKKEDDEVVGIDLGTTNSSVCIWRNGKYEMINDEYGHINIPSIVAITNFSKYVGYEAKNQKEINVKNVYYEVKRIIGKKINDESVIKDKEFLTYEIHGDEKNNIKINNQFYPEQIISYILMKLKDMASNYLKKEINKAVIAVPAYFNDAQRMATKNAAQIAGIDCLRILSEPIASALAYGISDKIINEKSKNEVNVIVYDLGGGTLDVSLVNIKNGLFEVLASAGNTHLGGSDFDTRLIRYSIGVFKEQNKIDDLNDITMFSIQQLKKSCERAKKQLSINDKTIIKVKNFYNEKNLLIHITRDKLNEICKDLILLCIKPLEDVLNSCELTRDKIDFVVLVGGMTHMPIIKENIKKYFCKEPYCHIDPECAVAIGSAIQGFILSHKTDPFSNDILLLDNTPLSLGVETTGGIMNVIIPRNSIIPTSKRKLYTTDNDNETSATIKIFEGERYLTKDNFKVGEFELSGLTAAPRGVAEIEVEITIDLDGIIHITAKDLKEGGNSSIIISGKTNNLTKEQITELIKNANEMELLDKIEKTKKQNYIELNDICDNILYNLSNSDEYRNMFFNKMENEKIIEEKNKIEKYVMEIQEWMKTTKEMEKIGDKIKEIKEKYGTFIYKNSKTTNNLGEDKKNDINCAKIFDEDDEKIFETIENENIKQTNNEEEIKKIKELKENLIQLCNDVYNIIKLSFIKLPDDKTKMIISYIDDVLLWLYVKQQLDITDLTIKINEINEKCNELFNNIDEIKINIKDELLQICMTILSSIHSNLFSCSEDIIKELENKTKNIIDNINEMNEEQCLIQKYELNNLCTKIYDLLIYVPT